MYRAIVPPSGGAGNRRKLHSQIAIRHFHPMIAQLHGLVQRFEEIMVDCYGVS